MDIGSLIAAPGDMDMSAAASKAGCARKEFSFLLAALLKSAQPGAVIEYGLLEQGETAGAEGVMAALPEAAEGSRPLMSASENEEESEMAMALPVAAFLPLELGRPVQKSQGGPAAETEAAGMVRLDALNFTELNPQDILKGKSSATLENNEAFDGRGKIELSKDLLVESGLREHFEIEIPHDEIMDQALDEPLAEPALAAAGKNASEPARDLSLRPQALDSGYKPFESSNIANADEKGASFEAQPSGRGQVEQLTASFQGTGTEDNSSSEEQPGQGVSFETQAVKSDAIAAGTTFEKTIEQAVRPQPDVSRPVATTAEVHEKLQAGIKVSVEQGGGEVKMKLNPESLGEVRIKLSVDSGMVKAEIMVENPEVKSIIEADASFLKESLGAHGLTLDKCVVEVGRSFDARHDEAGDGSRSAKGDEHRPMKDREEEKGNGGWQRHLKKQYARHEDGGVDFFI